MHIMRAINCLLCLVLFLCGGCATSLSHVGADIVPFGIYNGTRANIVTMAGTRTWYSAAPDGRHGQWIATAAIDFPFSLAFDTVLLPVDGVIWLHVNQ